MDGNQGARASLESYIAGLEFADELVVLRKDLTTSQAALQRATKYALDRNLKINTTKTKMFVISASQAERIPKLSGQTIKVTTDFKYLGFTTLPDG